MALWLRSVYGDAENANRVLLADENVRGVLINTFGDVLRCYMVALGVVEAAKDLGEGNAGRGREGIIGFGGLSSVSWPTHLT